MFLQNKFSQTNKITRVKISSKLKILLIILSILVFVASSTVISRILLLKEEVNERTLSYVSDVSAQLAKDIDNRLAKDIMDLKVIYDSILDAKQSNDDELKELLERKSQLFDFSSIVVIDTENQVFQTKPLSQDIYNLSGIQASLNGHNSVTFLDKQSILYSIPILYNGKVAGALGGIRDKKNMQTLIQSGSFFEQGLSCIVDKEGKVIISPTELEPFMQLDRIFQEEPGSKTTQDIHQMKKNMKDLQSGGFQFTAVDGTDLVMSYNPLNSYDWVLLTLLPSDIISSQINSYMNQTFIVIIGVVILLISILLALFMSQRSHYKQMEKIIFVDNITGGMNNLAFRLKCESLIPNSPPNTYSVVLLNIKKFKLINEQFGSEQGNNVLRKIMDILKESCINNGFAAHADADNFYLCLNENKHDQILLIIDFILKKVDEEVTLFNRNRTIPIHFVLQSGVYIIDDPSLDITIIQDRAKAACQNRSLLEDRVCKFYDTSIMKQWEKELELNGLFESSLRNHDFQIYLQPKVYTNNNKIGAAEALVRWYHPHKGMIFPSDFIPLFEANGNICKLDIYVFEEVCKIISHWEKSGKELLPISVNLSRQHFQRPNCLKVFADIAIKYQIPEKIIELELTESIFFDDQGIESVKDYIKEMHHLGFLCSLDDFGAGYSSLGLLMEFDVDAIKLDRKFFKDIKNPKVKDVVASTVELSHKIGISTIAEGIETPEQLEFIKEVRCDMVQGYIYSKPLPATDFELWVQKHTKKNGQ